MFQTSITLLWTLYELARHPSLQEELRAEVAAARAESQGDMLEMLKQIPLVKGALKETLRLKRQGGARYIMLLIVHQLIDFYFLLTHSDPVNKSPLIYNYLL